MRAPACAPTRVLGSSASRISGGTRIKELAETLSAGQFKILASLARDLDGTLWDVRTGEVEERTAAEALNEVGALYDLKKFS